ncbi:hypothetical protein FS749_013355 [Ceratobasidium sp. UAMH 11750]|nr:hypothetical protein FS749_013355 [Ceratobasidium sp. UAMH 11750]
MDSHIIQWKTSDAPSVPSHPEGFSHVPNPDTFGYVNWMELLTPSSDIYQKWCRKAGAHVAKVCLKEQMYSGFSMDGFPQGYALFCHHKTSLGKEDRNDVYLYGAKGGIRFRSPNEFLLHAQWLMEGAKEDKCKCKWCTGGFSCSQIKINARFNLPGLQVRPERRLRD